MARCADCEGRVDGVGVHAGLGVVVDGDEGPVCDDAGDADGGGGGGEGPGDEVFDGGGVEEFDVGEGEDFGEEGGGEEGGVFDDDVGAFVFVGLLG